MFCIEKNDKPNWIQRKLNLLKVMNDTILIPLTNKTKEKQIDKMAKKTIKAIKKHSNNKKVVLSKEIQKQEIYVNYLNTYGLDIQNGRWLFEVLLPQVMEYIIDKKDINRNTLITSILINDLTDIEIENISTLARTYKNINIVTNHMDKFKKLEQKLNAEGIIITITNNKKRSLMKSQIILNIDFTNELINKYNIKEDAIIVNVKGKNKITNKRFNGLNINDYEIDYRDDIKDEKCYEIKYFIKDLYESKLYKKQNINEIKNTIKLDKVIIKKLILNNGEL